MILAALRILCPARQYIFGQFCFTDEFSIGRKSIGKEITPRFRQFFRDVKIYTSIKGIVCPSNNNKGPVIQGGKDFMPFMFYRFCESVLLGTGCTECDDIRDVLIL